MFLWYLEILVINMNSELKRNIKKYIVSHPKVGRLLLDGFGRGKIKIDGSNNIVVNKAVSMKHCLVSIKGNNNNVKIGYGARLNNVIISIIGNNHIICIDENVRFVHGGSLKIEDEGNRIEICENTTIYNAFLSCGDKNTSIKIGKDCLFSVDVILRTSDSHSIIDVKSGKRINSGKSIIIADHVWLCNGVNVLKGVAIGQCSVIGTQSVVTKDIPCNSVACGNPARIVRSGVTWNEERIY